jgi:hypothetical protein
MSAARRFFDDEQLRRACVQYVVEQDSEKFFNRPNWREELFQFANEFRQQHELNESFETPEERRSAITKSLEKSKKIIEAQLPGHTVRHLCYPWHRYSIDAACLAREAGYISAHIDINPQKPAPVWNNPYTRQTILPINEAGDDPYQITRIDARPNMILSLPGAGRLTYRRRYLSKLLRKPQLFKS